MADWNDPATWAQAYNRRGGKPNKTDTILPTGAGFGEISSYLDGRKYQLQRADDKQPGLSALRFTLNKLGLIPAFTPATDVLVVGCGFGWLIEVMLEAGSNGAWGTDLSTVIHANIATADVPQEVQDRVLNIDIEAVDAKAQFQAAGAGTNQGEFRWIITEHLLEDWPIGDINSILDACDNLRAPGQGGVAHLVVATDAMIGGDIPTGMDPEIVANQFLLAEWVALRPAHWWINAAGSGDIEIGGGQ